MTARLARRERGWATRWLLALLALWLVASCSSPDETEVDSTVQLLAQKSIDLTGFVPPSTTSSSAEPITPEHAVDIVVPDSGWIRITLSGLGWVSSPGVKQNWSVLVGSEKMLRSDMTVIGTTSPGYVSYQLVTDMKGQSAKLEPGEALTLAWGWSIGDADAGTAFFDNSVSTMTVEAVPPPADVSTAPGATLGSLTTPENVATVAGRASSQTASWAAAPREGDLLLALVVADAEAGSFVLPDGWSPARSIRAGTEGELYSALFWKVAGATEPSDVTFESTDASLSALHLWSKRGFSGVPTVERSNAVSMDAYREGAKLNAGASSRPPRYVVTWLVSEGAATIPRAPNGFDSVFDDSQAQTTMAAAEKTLLVTGTPQINPAIGSPESVGLALVVFSGL